MAGLDGVENKIHPGEAATKDLYHLPPEEDAKIPTVCSSLEQALEYLDKDRAFLTKGGVFTDAYIDAYIELKMQEVTRFRMTTHPVEFDMYYSLCRRAAAARRSEGTALPSPFRCSSGPRSAAIAAFSAVRARAPLRDNAASLSARRRCRGVVRPGDDA